MTSSLPAKYFSEGDKGSSDDDEEQVVDGSSDDEEQVVDGSSDDEEEVVDESSDDEEKVVDESSDDEEEVVDMEELKVALEEQAKELKLLGTQLVLQKMALRDKVVNGPPLSKRFHEAQDKATFIRSALFESNAAYEVSEEKEDLDRVTSEQKKLILAAKEYTRAGIERLFSKAFVNGDWSYDTRETFASRLKEGATNNSIPANKIRKKIYAAFKVAGYEDTTTHKERETLKKLNGKQRIFRMENILYADAPPIWFNYRYADKKGNLKAPVIYHRRYNDLLELGLSEEQLYMQVALFMASDLETAPEVYNAIYIALVVLPKMETSRLLVDRWHERKIQRSREALWALRRQRFIQAGEDLPPELMTDTERLLRDFSKQNHLDTH